MGERRNWITAAGMGAILLWSCMIGLTRILSRSLGPLTTGAAVFGLAGLVGCAILLATPARRARVRGLPKRYLLGCGGLFTAYTVSFYASVGLAAGPKQVLEVGVINYLWPGLTVLFSVPLLGKRARAILPLGAVLAFAGVVAAVWPQDRLSLAAFGENLRANAVPYLLALVCAVTWSLYSVLARRWAAPAGGGAVPLFLLASSVVTAALAAFRGEQPYWHNDLLGPLLYTALGPALAAYLLWELGMRRGNVTLLASAAYAIPVLSSIITSALLGILPPPSFWIGCGMVAVGAAVCKLGVRETTDAETQRTRRTE